MEAQIQLRENLKPYILEMMKEAAKNGSPVMRAMFYEFPNDANCWELTDQYMFGSKYLVAPVLHAKEKERSVYLPAGTWENLHTQETIEGGRTITVATPLEQIPVFVKK